MVSIQTRRAGIICLAANANDDRQVVQAWGLTQASAASRLLRRMDRAAVARLA